MTRTQAWRKAFDLWVAGYSSPSGTRRYAFACLRRKNVVDRCEIGYHDEGQRRVIKGAGPTWEIAFERALNQAHGGES